MKNFIGILTVGFYNKNVVMADDNFEKLAEEYVQLKENHTFDQNKSFIEIFIKGEVGYPHCVSDIESANIDEVIKDIEMGLLSNDA